LQSKLAIAYTYYRQHVSCFNIFFIWCTL
jgi:hypothetical protein